MIGRLDLVECCFSYVVKMISDTIVTLVSFAVIVPRQHSLGRNCQNPLKFNQDRVTCYRCPESVSPPLALNCVECSTASLGFVTSVRTVFLKVFPGVRQ